VGLLGQAVELFLADDPQLALAFAQGAVAVFVLVGDEKLERRPTGRFQRGGDGVVAKDPFHGQAPDNK
jgi:hypothetical protein